MAATSSDIAIVLTGGSNNYNPDLSIGGNPSSYPITGYLNNLFDNVSDIKAAAGTIDYRCIYIFNNNSINTIYNVQVYTTELENAISTISIGINSSAEVQKITINGSVTGGSFQISYKPPNQETIEYRTVNYNSDPATWASNLKNELLTIPTIDQINVLASGTFSSRTFDVQFTSVEDRRSHDLIGVNVSGLTGASITGSVTKTTAGGPINSIPTLLDVSTTVPYDVSFYETNSATTLFIGNLYPEEGFPLWIKRIVPENADSVSGDGFRLKILGSSI
jgi:hypothetical protein